MKGIQMVCVLVAHSIKPLLMWLTLIGLKAEPGAGCTRSSSMNKEAMLMDNAVQVAKENGHLPSLWQRLPQWPTACVSFCSRCGASLAIDTEPLSRGGGFRGSALDKECN